MNTEQHFWAKVDRRGDAECWLWQGAPCAGGYGKMSWGGKLQYAHRLAYYLAHGLLDRELVVDHKCHNRMCCNPAHLQLTDTSGNMQNRAGPQANSRSGVRGVHRQRGRWRVQIRVDGRNVSGGCFGSLEEADAAARALRRTLMRNSLPDAV